jgi:hypothetical protein
MADDDETVYKAARAATTKVAGNLNAARKQVSSARDSFQSTVGLASWGSLGDKLAKRKSCASRYKELQSALAAADAALAKAAAACDALTRATSS